MAGRARRTIDGVVLLDKPCGLTSQRAVSRVKALTGAAKVGHTGTLDPLATGLLPLTFGEATKFSQALLDADKGYVAVLQLGVTTTTGDAEGEILERKPVAVSREDIDSAIPSFVGSSQQTPPMYSALKVDGKPLYAYARNGVELERAPRSIHISGLRVLEARGERLTLEVACSKGTYVRVLAEDIGRALGCGASLATLRRTRVGRFSVDDAVTLDAFEQLSESDRAALLMPVDALVEDLSRVDLSQAEAERMLRGQAVPHAHRAPALVRVYDAAAKFIGVAEVSGERGLKPRRLVSTSVDKP